MIPFDERTVRLETIWSEDQPRLLLRACHLPTGIVLERDAIELPEAEVRQALLRELQSRVRVEFPEREFAIDRIQSDRGDVIRIRHMPTGLEEIELVARSGQHATIRLLFARLFPAIRALRTSGGNSESGESESATLGRHLSS